jgi:hypothetical protein
VDALQAIITRLVSAGAGVAGVDIFAGNDNVGPEDGVDEHIIVMPTPGRTPEGTHNEGFTAYRRPSFQIVAKAERYPDAHARAEIAYDALQATNETIGGVFFLSMMPLQEPFALPPDAQGRSRVVFNIATHRRG